MDYEDETNGDALRAFVGQAGKRFAEGDEFSLPGGQAFRVVRYSVRKTDKRLFLTLSAKCSLCSKRFDGTYDVWRLRNGGRLLRTCRGHPNERVQEGTWLTTEEIVDRLQEKATLARVREEARAERRAEAEGPGPVQQVVLEVIADLDVVGGSLPAQSVIERVARRLSLTDAPTDQRKGRARQALRALERKGLAQVVW